MFAGTCGAGYVCEGDAIQCAMAKDQIMRNCQAYEPDNNPQSITNAAISGADNVNTDKMKADRQVVNVGSFSTSGYGWSRSCPADPVFALPWASGAPSFAIPFSRLCGPLGIMSDMAVALTTIGCLLFCLRVPMG